MPPILAQSPAVLRIILILAIAAGAHVLVRLVRRLGRKVMVSRASSSYSKVRTVTSLSISIVVFAMYFVAVGLVLKEFGISLTAYFASATIIGLAVGFGSQGLVQDVVNGLTVVFSDLFDVGDMVEIAGQTGIVQQIGIRFTVLTNFMGAEVFIPNRTITNVVKYERGYVRALADITFPPDPASAGRVEELVGKIVESISEQFPGILITTPSIKGRQQTSSGKKFLRVKFRIWPGQGGPLEASFKREVVESLKSIDSAYSDWMVVLSYEVEKKPVSLPGTSKHSTELKH
ncbi:MAG: mechanosensitive ion channel family protein [Deltaproteobacteria bacterium]|jgi:small conductance mechanosensitive channel|nr:mechanosensitive ion channel family protein [Deltaproteobacteria bacterium]